MMSAVRNTKATAMKHNVSLRIAAYMNAIISLHKHYEIAGTAKLLV